MLDLKTIRYFLTVLRARNLSRASEKLHITQSALTKRIQQLEERLDVRLLSRQSHGVEPTFFGEIVGKHAQKIQTDIADMERELLAAKEGSLGMVYVGVGVRWQNRMLIDAVSRMTENAKGLHIKITGGLHEPLMQKLRRGDLDIVLGGPASRHQKSEFISTPLFKTRICVVGRRKHPLARKKPKHFGQLLEYPWILPYPHYPTRTNLYALFDKHGVPPPEPLIEAESTLITVSLLANTDMLTVASEHRLELMDTGALGIVELPAAVPPITGSLNCMRDRELSPAAQAFKTEIEAEFARK